MNGFDVRETVGPGAETVTLLKNGDGAAAWAMRGAAFTTAGLGLTAGEPGGLVMQTDSADEAAGLATWFDGLWSALPAGDAKDRLLSRLDRLAAHDAPPRAVRRGPVQDPRGRGRRPGRGPRRSRRHRHPRHGGLERAL